MPNYQKLHKKTVRGTINGEKEKNWYPGAIYPIQNISIINTTL